MSNKFEYKYSAPTQEERKEIESIRNQYLPKDEKTQKLERLRYLDNKVTNLPVAVSISLGVIGTLIFGTGMCFFLEWVNLWFIGIPFSIVGMLIIILAYPTYNKLLNKLKNKYKDEIISISNELMNK